MKTNLENIGAADVQAMMKQQDRLFRNGAFERGGCV